MPICRLMRFSYCQFFEGTAAFGYNETTDQTTCGFREHVGIAWSGAVKDIAIAPANEHDVTVAPEVLEGGPRRGDPREVSRSVLGNTAYHSPPQEKTLQESIQLETPSRARLRQERGFGPSFGRVSSTSSSMPSTYGPAGRWHLTVR